MFQTYEEEDHQIFSLPIFENSLESVERNLIIQPNGY